jgi:cytochrome P450
LWATLAADHAKIPAAIEEVLRMSPSVITWRRRTLRPVTVAGTELPAGANVLLLLGSANRDEAVFPDGERFDLERPNARNHLSFGYGIHYCLGALLAKMQMQIVLEELLTRFPDIRLAPDAHIEYLPNAAFRGPRALLVAGL